MKKIQISLTDEQLTNVTLLATLQDRSIAWVFRDLLDRYEKELIKAIRKLEKVQ